jgi:transcriptional regulator with XRE-family HTH domain
MSSTRKTRPHGPLPPPSARAAQGLRALREAEGWSHATVAAILTSLGMPTKEATIARIERGTQAMSVDQLAALSLLASSGMAGLLGPPFRVGEVSVGGVVEVDALLAGIRLRDPQSAFEGKRALLEPIRASVDGVVARERAEQVASYLGIDVDQVVAAAAELWPDQTVGSVLKERVAERFRAVASADADLSDPDVELVMADPWVARRAFITNAIRTVGRDIRAHLDEQETDA